MKTWMYIFISFFFASCVQPTASVTGEDPLPNSTTSNQGTAVLIYGGPGSWKAEVASLKKILFHHEISYDVLISEQINQLSINDYSKYKAIIFAGGDAPTVRSTLSIKTRANLREAVQIQGLNYLGFCAGAWLAVAPAPDPSGDVIYGIGVVNGPIQQTNFLFKLGKDHGLDRAQFPDGSQRNLLWYGGPVTPNIPNSVIAKYSDGTPAISQIHSGKGLVIISGLHPAATKAILIYLGLNDSEAIAPDFAWSMLEAILFNKSLPTFQ